VLKLVSPNGMTNSEPTFGGQAACELLKTFETDT